MRSPFVYFKVEVEIPNPVEGEGQDQRCNLASMLKGSSGFFSTDKTLKLMELYHAAAPHKLSFEQITEV